MPYCFFLDCGTPPTVTGGTVSSTSGTTVGETATYTCDTGYTIDGASTNPITCQTSGSWETAPVCNINGELLLQ